MKKYTFILSIILLLTACGGKQAKQQSNDSIPGNLTEIRLGAMSSMDYVPFVIAQKKGIYDSLGLKVNIVKFFSANDRDAAFQTGNIDGTVIDFTGAIIQHANGIDLQMVMKNDGFFYFIAGKQSNINELSELKGRNIAVSRNTVIEFSTDKALESVGISPDEVNKPEINKIPLRLEMLQNGQIDASIFPDPFATIAKNNGHKSLVTTQDLGISVTGTMFTGKALQEKKEEIKVLLKGYNLAVDYMKKHSLDDWSQILIDDVGLPENLLTQITLPKYQHAKLPEKNEIATTIQWLKAKQLISQEYNGEQLITSSFISK